MVFLRVNFKPDSSLIMRTRIKFCGFTRAEDARYAARLGVDAIGLVFYPSSPRNVTIEQAVEIVESLPAFVSVVALFVDAEITQVRDVLAKVPVDCLQFHGDEPPEICRLFGKRYIKAVRMKESTDIKLLAERYHDAGGLLLDAYHPEANGGTGQCFDWELMPSSCVLPIILAGGLDELNVGMAITQTKPYAVDVSSGIESNKGIKDNIKMAAFIKAVMQGDIK